MKRWLLLIPLLLLCTVVASYYSCDNADDFDAGIDTTLAIYDHLMFIPDTYYQYVVNAGIQYHVPVYYLAKLLEVESGYDAYAIGGPNSNGSYDYGIAQFNSMYIDEFAFRYGVDLNPFDPYISIEVAARHLRVLYNNTGSWELALAAYNCGLTAVKRGNIPQSTVRYVAKIMGGI